MQYQPTIFHSPLARICLRISLAVLVCLLRSSANAQSPTDGKTPLGLSPGAPAGSYALSGFENVNPYNGNLNFHLPLLGIGGRGGAATGSMLEIDAKSWTVKRTEVTDPNTGDILEVYTPSANWWALKGGYGPGSLGGRQSGANPNLICGFNKKIYQQTLTRLTFTASDGTEYEFRDDLTRGQPATVSNPCASGASRGTVFITADGTAATFISDTTIYDKNSSSGPSTISPSGYLLLRDGTKYRIDSGRVSWLRDRNGNKLTFAYDASARVSTITDSLNRQVTFTYANMVSTFADQITYKGFGGTPRTLLIAKTSLSNALRAGYYIQSYHNLFPELNNAGSGSFNPTVASAVTLPNGKQYQFKYNSYGELARVVLPTGGAIEYDYTAGSGAVSDGTDYQIFRGVIERRVYPDGSTLEGKTTYSRSYSGPGDVVTVDRLNPGGTLLAREKHYYYGSAETSLFTDGISYPFWQDGREYQTEALDTNGATLLRRVNNTWPQGVIVSPWNTAIPNNTRLGETTTTLEPGGANLVSKQTFGYDDTVPYNNQNNVKEYDFGSGAPGALVRETRTTFITDSSYTGTSVHLRSLASQVSVHDGGGTERARNVSEYDNYATDTNHAALWNRPSISSFDSAFNTSYTTRGNVTGTTSYLLNGSGGITGSISAYTQYDIAGNVKKVIDGRGYATTIEYDDCFGAPNGNARLNSAPLELSSVGQASYALPTSVTNAMGQVSFAQFDYYTGRPVDGEDVNGIVASGYSDSDSLDRPTKIIRAFNTPAQNQTLFAYDDTARTITTSSDQVSFNDPTPLKSQIVYDGLGRTTETRQYEGGTNYIATQQQYDALGRAYKSSNPFRPWQSESAVWTTTAFDALGRVTTVTTPDSAFVSTSYNGNTVTATDQAGKARKSVTDGLGRLTAVYEDPSALNYLTSYNYDVLDNLTSVSQGVQTRTFVYDSFNRLTSATNPESGTVTYGYDNNGNLTSKLDARNITTTLLYDALNRVTSKSYNDNPQTPTVSYFYDSQSLPSGAPSFDRGWATGRLVAVIYGGGASAGTYRGYDQMGRVVRQYQRTDSVNYLVEATYWANSAVKDETYPSVPGAGDRRLVSYVNDSAGRLASLSSAATTYAPGASVSSIGYASHNAPSTETYGNNLIHAMTYNNRLQPNEIKLGTSGAPTSIVSLSYNYGTTNNNGNLQSVTYAGGGLSYTQTFGYDQLNRITTSQENSGANWSQTNGYDRYGNRWIDLGGGNQSLYFNTANNRITTSGYSYDSVGNLTNDGTHAYTFDAEYKISKVDAVSVYVYDGEGQRVRKLVGENLRFIYDMSGKEVAEFDGAAGTLKKEYVYGASGLVATIEPTAVNANGTRYTTSDHLGSPRVVTNSGAGVVSRHDYKPFGEEIGSGIGGRTTGMGYGVDDGLRQKFTQKERDIETGLDYFGARYYASMQGRFTGADPIFISDKQTGNPQLWNLYNYVGNNPLNATDPTGMELVRLGQHSDEQIAKRRKEIDDEKKAIRKDSSLTRAQQDEKRGKLEAEKNTLGLEKEGNKVANAMLTKLDSIGERQGLQVSDFTLTTDSAHDFAGIVAGDPGIASDGTVNAMFGLLGSNTSEIFINTQSRTYRGSVDGSGDIGADDFRTYAGTLAVHERTHRDSPTREQRVSEPRAYTEQLRVLRKFGPGAFRSRDYYQKALALVERRAGP